jgi:hypothetical protein
MNTRVCHAKGRLLKELLYLFVGHSFSFFVCHLSQFEINIVIQGKARFYTKTDFRQSLSFIYVKFNQILKGKLKASKFFQNESCFLYARKQKPSLEAKK